MQASGRSVLTLKRAALKMRDWLPRGRRTLDRHILVHNMAKVGSITVVESVGAEVRARSLEHTHTLSPTGIDHAERCIERLEAGESYRNHLNRCRRVAASLADQKFHVISPVRDPIARDISYFFECLPLLKPQLVKRCADGSDHLKELQETFIEHLDASSPLHLVPNPTEWFQKEVEPVFGVDVYSHHFDHTQKWTTIRGESASFLILRLEDMHQLGGDAIGRFLGIDKISIQSGNTGTIKAESRPHYRFYRDFVRNISLPTSYMDSRYDSQYSTHFYSPGEIDSFRNKWHDRH